MAITELDMCDTEYVVYLIIGLYSAAVIAVVLFFNRGGRGE
jgi:hypothetical protein